MRIAFTNWSNRMAGGAEQYIAQLADYLALRGHEVSLWHQTSEPKERPVIPMATRAPAWDVSRLGAEAALSGLRRWKPDVIYCQGSNDPETERETLSAAPSVFFAHNYHGVCVSGSKCHSFPAPRPCTRKAGLGCLVNYLPRRCGGLNPFTLLDAYQLNRRRLEVLRGYSKVVTHSEALAEEYARHGVECTRLRFFADRKDESRSLPPWNPGASWRLLMMGRMMATKGGQLLLDALPALSRILARPVELTMAGDGPARGDWEKLANSIQKKCPQVGIHFPGWITGEARDRVFEQTDLLVVPSVWPEPFGLGGLELGAWGVPSVAFRVGGIPDWLTERHNGALARELTSPALATAMARCLADDATYRGLRAGAYETAQRMTVDAHYEDLMKVFRGLTGEEAVRDSIVDQGAAVAGAAF